MKCLSKKLLIIFLFIYYNSKAQDLHSLHVGDKVPQSVFYLLPHQQHEKLIILDFWSSHCGSCIAAFPALATLQWQFQSDINIIPVNSWESAKQAGDWLYKINQRRRQNGDIPLSPDASRAVYNDSVFIKLFPTMTIPQHVWLDTTGKVLAITTGYNTTAGNIKKYLERGTINLRVKNDSLGNAIRREGLLKPLNDQIPTSYYSAFVPNTINFPFNSAGFEDTARGVERRIIANESVGRLYSRAFYQALHPFRILWETSNKEIQEQPADKNQWDDWAAKYRFSYIIQAPLKDHDKLNVNEKLRQDVNYFFGLHFGIVGVVEKRTLNAFVLKKTKDGLLKNPASDQKYRYIKGKLLQLQGEPFSALTNQLRVLENMQAGHPFMDETGIDPQTKINITLTGDISNLKNVRAQLHRYGLDIQSAEREVEVLVIKDKNAHY